MLNEKKSAKLIFLRLKEPYKDNKSGPIARATFRFKVFIAFENNTF
jgi:hypothetical protein